MEEQGFCWLISLGANAEFRLVFKNWRVRFSSYAEFPVLAEAARRDDNATTSVRRTYEIKKPVGTRA